MATLTYWACEARNDSECYTIVKKTKKEAKAAREGREEDFCVPVKLTITYKDGFDLFEQVTGEGGGRLCGIPDKD